MDSDDPCYVSVRRGTRYSGDVFLVHFCDVCRRLCDKDDLKILRIENVPPGWAKEYDHWACEGECADKLWQGLTLRVTSFWRDYVIQRLLG